MQPVLLTRGDEGRELLLPGVERFTCSGAMDSSLANVTGNLASARARSVSW